MPPGNRWKPVSDNSGLEVAAQFIENRIFDELHLGDAAEMTRTLESADMDIAPGQRGTDFICELLSTQLPGPGAIYQDLSLRFASLTSAGGTVTVRVRVRTLAPDTRQATFDCECISESGQMLIEGQVRVIVPTVKLRRRRVLGDTSTHVAARTRYQQLLDAVHHYRPIRTAIVHPCDEMSIVSAIEAWEAGLIVPVLVGPKARILKLAADAHRELGDFEIIDVPHSHAAAGCAVALGREGKVEALMKGALHTDEFMEAVVDKAGGLRTERRMSHVFVLDAPHYTKPLFITDAAINIAPDLDTKRDIVRNAIDLAHALGIPSPKVAILCAVETVSAKMPSTIDAAALCKMAERQQILGGILDGPLAFDNAISLEAARSKGISGPVAGQADILVVPDLEAGNMLVKQLVCLAGAQDAGIVLGARLPIILTSRADGETARLASCALAQLLVHRRKPN
jgi:phosphate acetyltransferase